MFEKMVTHRKTRVDCSTVFHEEFHCMGGTMRYLSADNRDFLLAFVREGH